jgi:hypothetical protein
MPVQLNHTIVHSPDKGKSAAFVAELFDLGEPKPFGPFVGVETANGVTLDFMDNDGEYSAQHYAFIVSEDDFDAIFGRIEAQGLDYYADPHANEPGQINHHDGGRGVYWAEPTSGHWLEIITRPYGSGG